MPCFYTHVLNSIGRAADEEGQEFVDLQAAKQSAMKAAVEIVAEELTHGRSRIDLEFHIDGETGERLATLPVSAVVSGIQL